jgi:2-polyprenyl-6-methoxyphenol hydroxylase-like FAD-dependent oxidoreductase
MSVRPKIVIIGGGIGGLTTAVALARRGLATEAYVQAPELKEVGAGVGRWANTLWVLEPIGLADAVLQLGARVARQGVKHPDGTWLMCYPEEALQKRWGPVSPPSTGPVSSACLPASSSRRPIHLGARCTGFHNTPEAVTAHFADGREVEADVLIGADGVHPPVRAKLLGPAPLRYRGYTVVRSLSHRGRVRCPERGSRPGARAASPTSPLRAARSAPDGTVPAPRELNKPVQVMCGDADPMLRPRASRDTAAAIPGASLVILPDVGHALPRAIWPIIAQELRALSDNRTHVDNFNHARLRTRRGRVHSPPVGGVQRDRPYAGPGPAGLY